MDTTDVPLWQENKEYLDGITPVAREVILNGIAQHYGITSEKAYEEVTSEGAETLLDYLIEPLRSATLLRMRIAGKLPQQLAQLNLDTLYEDAHHDHF